MALASNAHRPSNISFPMIDIQPAGLDTKWLSRWWIKTSAERRYCKWAMPRTAEPINLRRVGHVQRPYHVHLWFGGTRLVALSCQVFFQFSPRTNSCLFSRRAWSSSCSKVAAAGRSRATRLWGLLGRGAAGHGGPGHFYLFIYMGVNHVGTGRRVASEFGVGTLMQIDLPRFLK